MLGAFFFMSEAQPFPGWRAAIPTAGCALVIAHPRSLVGDVALGNRVAGFFGVISYPLYLWHWPALRLRPYVARHHSDARRDARAGGGRGRSRDPHLPS